MKYSGIRLLITLATLLHSTLLYATANPLLKSVPADSLFFSGNTELISISDYPLVSFSHSFEAPMSSAEQQNLGKEFSFFYELFRDFEQIIQQGNQVVQSHYGLADEMAAVIYTVGATPVIKFNLKDQVAFLSILDKAEQKSGFKPSSKQFKSLKYRSYLLDNQHELIVSIQNYNQGEKLVTIALLSQTLTEHSRKLIFDQMKPLQSIVDTGKLERIQQENQYLPLSVSFIDFQQLVKSLFKEQNNPWIELLGEDAQSIAQLQTSQCQADVLAIIKDMPRMIAGYKNYQVRGQQVNLDFEVLLELKNKNVKAELDQFRGFIPDYIRTGARDHILAFGLGANMSQLSPMFFYITRAFKESTFQCPELIKMQKEVAKINPAMLALVTGVVDGIKGISFAIQDFKLSKSEQSASMLQADLSMILSMVAENPVRVWQMLSAFIPEIAMVMPSEQPQKLNLPDMDALGLDIYIAAKGQHLTLYTGDKAAKISQQLVNEAIVSNGFFQESLNYTRLANAVSELRDYMASPQSPQLLPAEACNYFDESIAMLSKISGFIDLQSDFVNSGWLNAMTAEIELMPATEKNFQLTGKFETLYVQDGCSLARDGEEEIFADGTGFYQQYSDDGQCFIFETRYRWIKENEKLDLQYVSERSRPEGLCSNQFEEWAVPSPEYINDVCQLRKTAEGDFACLYQWDDELTKSVYKRI